MCAEDLYRPADRSYFCYSNHTFGSSFTWKRLFLAIFSFPRWQQLIIYRHLILFNVFIISSCLQLVSTGVYSPEGLAYDWVSHNLYWTDYILETIEVVSIDNGYRTVLLSANISNPRAIAVDPSQRSVP